MSKFWRAYVAAVEAFCFAGIAAILAVGILQVFARYVMHSSLFWSEEFMRYMMLWIVALGAGVSYSRGQFLGMRMVVEKLPPPLRRAADLVSAVLVLVFLAVVIWHGLKFSWGTRLQSAVALNVSMFWVHVSVVAGCVLLAIHVALNELFGVAREPRTREEHVMGAEEAL
ncbi:TRAP transporter small permease subunit [Paracoccus sp. S-4012]|uniref:TRAP transporter small permease n=1 Tax=Paracoccus sp. S-4012 TaxID=2665648 RepID=UPI0012AEE0D5|nr:TRAP transporter small permease [Paracoccus sp. S-4012]MRX49394.1 TRAP transporter small permease subunit [Paracoccus sp. S-4012]